MTIALQPPQTIMESVLGNLPTQFLPVRCFSAVLLVPHVDFVTRFPFENVYKKSVQKEPKTSKHTL